MLRFLRSAGDGKQSTGSPFIAAIIGGFCLALTLPRPGLCLLAWVALAPVLYYSTLAPSYRRAGLLGWLFGVTFFGTTLHWIYSTCRFAQVPIPISFLAWFSLCALLGSIWAVYGVCVRRIAASLPEVVWPWAWACVWVTLEFATSHSRLGLFLLGYTQWKFLSLIQGISWTGTYGLSFLIVLVNGIFALAIRVMAGFQRDRRGRTKTPVAAAALLLGWWAYGLWSLSHRRTTKEMLPIAILQPDVDQYRKWDADYATDIRSNINELLRSLPRPSDPAHPRLVLWPESSVPGWLDDPENFHWVMASARRTRAHQLLGVLTRSEDQEHNSAVMINPDGKITGFYHKRQLVPFGEFVPFRPLFASWIGILDQMGDFSPGPAQQTALESPVGRVGITICYEAVYPRWTRMDAEKRAQIIANVTNDGWYKDTWGPYQHFYINIFRAVENRIPIMRAANTGISGMIDPYGIVTRQLGLEHKGVLLAEVPMTDAFSQRSFYCRWGNWFPWLNIFTLFMLVLWAKRFNMGKS